MRHPSVRPKEPRTFGQRVGLRRSQKQHALWQTENNENRGQKLKNRVFFPVRVFHNMKSVAFVIYHLFCEICVLEGKGLGRGECWLHLRLGPDSSLGRALPGPSSDCEWGPASSGSDHEPGAGAASGARVASPAHGPVISHHMESSLRVNASSQKMITSTSSFMA